MSHVPMKTSTAPPGADLGPVGNAMMKEGNNVNGSSGVFHNLPAYSASPKIAQDVSPPISEEVVYISNRLRLFLASGSATGSVINLIAPSSWSRRVLQIWILCPEGTPSGLEGEVWPDVTYSRLHARCAPFNTSLAPSCLVSHGFWGGRFQSTCIRRRVPQQLSGHTE